MEDAADSTLLDAWRAGDEGAGNVLLQRHFDCVYRYFVTKVEGGVEDMVQRTFLASVEARDRIRDGASFKTYVLGIAHNLLLKRFRGERRNPTPVQIEHALDDGAETMAGLMIKRDEQRLLLRALRRLPWQLQAVIELHYWEGLRIKEIAPIVGAPEGTVKYRLSEARTRLRGLIEELATTENLRRSTLDALDRWAASIRGRVGPTKLHA